MRNEESVEQAEVPVKGSPGLAILAFVALLALWLLFLVLAIISQQAENFNDEQGQGLRLALWAITFGLTVGVIAMGAVVVGSFQSPKPLLTEPTQKRKAELSDVAKARRRTTVVNTAQLWALTFGSPPERIKLPATLSSNAAIESVGEFAKATPNVGRAEIGSNFANLEYVFRKEDRAFSGERGKTRAILVVTSRPNELTLQYERGWMYLYIFDTHLVKARDFHWAAVRAKLEEYFEHTAAIPQDLSAPGANEIPTEHDRGRRGQEPQPEDEGIRTEIGRVVDDDSVPADQPVASHPADAFVAMSDANQPKETDQPREPNDINLSPLAAKVFKQLQDSGGATFEDIAEALAIEQSEVSNRLREVEASYSIERLRGGVYRLKPQDA